MNRFLKLLLALLLCLATCLSVYATQPSETAPAPTEPAVPNGFLELPSLPGNWSPLSPSTPEKELLRSLTGASLYAVDSNGAVIPQLAVSLPQDVTAQYAGDPNFNIPASAQRGYAFQIDLNPDACWEDGIPIFARDYVFSLEKLLKDEGLAAHFSFLANVEGLRSGREKTAETVISLQQAGFSTVAQAAQAGYSRFYLDIANFWGLDGGWLPVSNRTRLLDPAMTPGLDEMYVTPAYLYTTYLRQGAPYAYLQPEFIGVTQTPEAVLTFSDVGILETDTFRLTLVLDEPATPTSLALQLQPLFLFRKALWCDGYGTAPETYCAYGPYKIIEASTEQILLQQNENWWGSAKEAPYPYLRLIPASKD